MRTSKTKEESALRGLSAFLRTRFQKTQCWLRASWGALAAITALFLAYGPGQLLLQSVASSLGGDARQYYLLQFSADVLILIAALLCAWKLNLFAGTSTFFKPGFGRTVVNALAVIGFVAGAMAVQVLVAICYSKLTGVLIPQNQIDIDGFRTSSSIWLFSIDIVLVAPIIEEIIFRGLVYRILNRNWMAFLFSAVAFALAHSGFSTQFFLYLVAGVVPNLAFIREHRLVDSIAVHVLWNATSVFLPLIF